MSCPANATVVAGQCHCNRGYDKNKDTGNTCSKVNERNQAKGPQQCPTCNGDPIYPLTGAQKLQVRTALKLKGLELVLTYDSTDGQRPFSADDPTMLVEPNGFGALWHSSFHHQLQVSPSKQTALLTRGDGLVLSFSGDGAGNFSPTDYNAGKLATVSGGYRYTDIVSGDLETFDSTGSLISLARADGSVLTFTYSSGNLTQVTADDGRVVQFTYTNNQVTRITSPDWQAMAVAYDTNKNLVSLTWPDSTVRTFVYENTTFPWALTGVIDENNARHATFAYDAEGRAVSTEQGGGVNRYSITYTTAPKWTVTDTYDTATDTINRVHAWQMPAGTTLTTPAGQSLALEAANIHGQPSVTSSSQPAGSGSAPGATASTYDADGNLASRDQADASRTCYVYDSSRRQIVRVEGLATTVSCASVTPAASTLPAGARKVTTAWHSDWKLPTAITEPLRKTTLVYHGQSDPFNANATANCTSAVTRADGKPLPVLCKRVEQALLANGTVDTSVAVMTTRYTYDAGGRVLTSTDPKNHLTTYAYYTSAAFTGGAGDSSFANVAFLVHTNGTNGSTAFIDTSVAAHPITASGTAQVSTGQSKFGGASAQFNGSNDYLSASDAPDFDFGSGDFTIEMFLRPASVSTAYSLISQWPSAGNLGYVIYLNGASMQFSYTTDGSTQINAIATHGMSAGQWYHFAVSRAGANLRMFINGVQIGSTYSIGSAAIFNSAGVLRIGRNPAADPYGYPYSGYLDDIRITKGVARYTASFTPPAAQFPDAGPDMNALGHTVGDLQSVTNAAGQVVQYTQYDPAGHVRQMIDAKGITSDITYTPRGWVGTVTVTPPGGSARTTTYSYDNAGQMTGVALPDGTSLAYTYDAAHRLTGVTDMLGNSVTYTLDAAGNRTGEEVRDGSGALQRSIARSFDALSRLQQVTGAAQ